MAQRALTDQGWLEFCEAGRLIPDDDARAELAACLFVEYPNMVYDAKRVATALRRWEKVLKHFNAAAALYRQDRLPRLPRDEFEAALEGRACAWLPGDVTVERDLHYVATLRRRALAHVLACRALRRANRGQENSQQAWLVSRLCGIWLVHFRGDLTVTVPPLGGEPRGPLIDFLRAAMGQVMTPPSPHTLRRAIERERAERENARQLRLALTSRRE